MNKSDVKVGQFWKSKTRFPNIGHYTVEILKVGNEIIMTKFTASEWEDGHWVDNHMMSIFVLLESYELL